MGLEFRWDHVTQPSWRSGQSGSPNWGSWFYFSKATGNAILTVRPITSIQSLHPLQIDSLRSAAASDLTTMGIWETFTDLVDAATPWSTAEAEAPPAEEQQQVRTT